MTILYLGDSQSSSTSYHRAAALQRLGHQVIIGDIFENIFRSTPSKYIQAFHYHSGFIFLQNKVLGFIKKLVSRSAKPDVIWVNSGELLNESCLLYLKRIGCPIVLYNNDDPTGKRDGNRFKLLLGAIKHYDLCVVMRTMNVQEFYNIGAKRVLRVFMSYDEVFHQPFLDITEIPLRFRSDVVFIGTWMRNEHRDVFIRELIKHGIPISIWGSRWYKSPLWKELKPFHKGDSISGRDYVAAIQASKVCLGLLSKGNRDQHTQRSMEIPFIGGLFCAERTEEHLSLYKEGEEAIFWSDANECAALCKQMLLDEPKATSIRSAGAAKIRSLGLGNEDVCKKILLTLFAGQTARHEPELQIHPSH